MSVSSRLCGWNSLTVAQQGRVSVGSRLCGRYFLTVAQQGRVSAESRQKTEKTQKVCGKCAVCVQVYGKSADQVQNTNEHKNLCQNVFEGNEPGKPGRPYSNFGRHRKSQPEPDRSDGFALFQHSGHADKPGWWRGGEFPIRECDLPRWERTHAHFSVRCFCAVADLMVSGFDISVGKCYVHHMGRREVLCSAYLSGGAVFIISVGRCWIRHIRRDIRQEVLGSPYPSG